MEQNENKYDPDMATLPILIAEWGDNINNSVITYQNKVLEKELGMWKDKTLYDFFDSLSEGMGSYVLSKLLNEKMLALPCKLNDLELKVHARVAPKHIQITITDNTELNRLRDLELRSKIIDSFLMIGSHELKTPLNSIIGMSSLLQEEEENTDKRELLDLVLESGENLNRIVVKMLKHIYSYNPEDSIISVDNQRIGETILNSSSLLNKYLEDRSFNLDKNRINDTHIVRLPEGSLQDILTEIAINLRRNTPPNGMIKISTYDKEGSVYLEVENESEGIPEAELERVFEPFYRYQSGMSHSSGFEYNQAGAGLGLTIMKRTVDNSGGKIWFENKYPYGQNKQNVVKLTISLPGHII